MEERRRTARHEVTEDVLSLPSTAGVRVLDISTAGVLLYSPRLLNTGSRAHLRFRLAGAPFSAEIVVRRASPVPGARSGYRIGATFVGVMLEHRQLIERFMNND